MLDPRKNNTRYSKFCSEKRVPPVSVTSDEMYEEFGIISEKKKLYFISMQKESKHGNQYYLPDTKHVELEIKQMVSGNLGKKDRGTTEPLVENWWLFDFISAFFHLILIIVMMSPVISLCLFTVLEQNVYSLAEPDKIFTPHDFIYTPWLIPFKFFHLDFVILSIMAVSAFYGAASLVDLVFYYLSLNFPLDTLKIFAAAAFCPSKGLLS